MAKVIGFPSYFFRSGKKKRNLSVRILIWSLVQVCVAREGTSITGKNLACVTHSSLVFGIFELKMTVDKENVWNLLAVGNTCFPSSSFERL